MVFFLSGRLRQVLLYFNISIVGSVYNNLYKKVSVYLDQNLNEEVSRQLLEEAPIGTKSDLVIDFAEDGAMSLLKKWPEMKSKLLFCLNQPLPIRVRQLAWRLYLTNTRGKSTMFVFLFILWNIPSISCYGPLYSFTGKVTIF